MVLENEFEFKGYRFFITNLYKEDFKRNNEFYSVDNADAVITF